LEKEPKLGKVLRQFEESLQAIRLHLMTYQTKIYRLSEGKPVESSDTPPDTPEDEEGN
jgi:hypothetical protein